MATSRVDIIIQAKDQASRVLQSIGAQTGQLQGSVDKLSVSNTNAKTRVEGMTSSFFKAGIAIEALRLGANLVTGAIQRFVDLGGEVLGSASAYEQSAIAFRVMIGDATKARNLLKDISTFAARTPFDLPDVVEGSRRLLAYNISAEKIIPTFQMLGDIAAGVGREKLPFLVTALGQVKAQTRLSGEELRQFTETGVPLIEELARVTGFSAAQIAGDTANLNISYGQVEQSLRNMTSEGGKFYGLMEQQAKTYDGTIANLRDNFMSMGREIIGISSDGTIRDGSIFQILSQKAQDLLNWVNQNRAGIEAWGKQVMDSVVRIIEQHVLPRLNAFSDWLTNPKYAQERQQWINKMNEFAGSLSRVASDGSKIISWAASAIDWFAKLYNGAKRVADALNAITNSGAGLRNFIQNNDFVKGALKGLFPNGIFAGFATGTSYAPGGVALVGERGPELVNLPRGSQVLTAEQTRSALSSSSAPVINIGTVINNTQADMGSLARNIGFQLSLRL